MAWIKALYERATKISSTAELFKQQLSVIHKFMGWNGYPRHVRRNIIRNVDQNRHTNPTNSNEQQLDEKHDVPAIWLRWSSGRIFSKEMHIKLKRCMKDKNIKFIVMYDTKKMAFFCSNKEKTPDSSNITYEFSYPRCCAKYVGKTERCFYTRNENSAVLKHSRNCADFQHTVDLHALPLIFSDSYKLSPSIMQHVQSAVFNHTRIIDRNNNWSELCILESLHIKRRNPIPNVGVKATKQGFP